MITNKNIVIEGYIYANYNNSSKGINFTFSHMGKDDVSKEFIDDGFIPISSYKIEIEIPVDIDLHKSHLIGLQNRRKLLLTQNQQKIDEIDAIIQEIMAIENK